MTNSLIDKPKPTNKFVKFILILLLIVFIVFAILFILYKTKVDIADKFNYAYDDIPILIDEYKAEGIDINKIISYDSESKTISFKFSKGFIYSNFEYQEHADEFKKNYNITINRFGYDVDPIGRTIGLFADVTYKDSINTFAYVSLKYEVLDSELKLILNNYEIGDNLPKWLYEEYLPYKIGDVLYTFKVNDIDGLEETGFKLKYLDSIDYFDNCVVVKTKTEEFILDLFNNYLDSLDIGIDINNEDYKEITNSLIPIITDDILKNLDFNNLKEIIEEIKE